jgi:hypothetical protein
MKAESGEAAAKTVECDSKGVIVHGRVSFG